jgi:hypothetical protein
MQPLTTMSSSPNRKFAQEVLSLLPPQLLEHFESV